MQDSYGGNFDLRPTVDPAKNLFMHDIPGIYIRHADDISFEDVSVRWEGTMHTNFKHGVWAEQVNGLRFKDSDIRAPRVGDKAFHLVDTALD